MEVIVLFIFIEQFLCVDFEVDYLRNEYDLKDFEFDWYKIFTYHLYEAIFVL